MVRRARLNGQRAAIHFVVLEVARAVQQVVGNPVAQLNFVVTLLQVLYLPDDVRNLVQTM